MLHGIKHFFKHMTIEKAFCYAGGLSLLMAVVLEMFGNDDNYETVDCEDFKEVEEDTEKENNDEAEA